MKFLELFIDSCFVWVSIFFIGKSLFGKERNSLCAIITIIVFSLILGYINFINSEVLTGTIKILSIYSLFCLFLYINFKKEYSKNIVAGLILYILFVLSEVIIMIITSLIFKFLGLEISTVKNNLIMNLLISLGVLFAFHMLKFKIKTFINNSEIRNKSKFIVILVILINLALLGYKLPVSRWKLDAEFIITMLILIIFCILGIFMIKQNSDLNNTYSKYNKVVEYSKTTNKLLEDYRMVNHEHKNQLSIIRNMVNSNNKELIDYLDNLIMKKNIVKYEWISDLNNLTLEGLKGLINYKLIEMVDNNIKVSVTISKESSKIKLNKLSTKDIDDLYSIIGVYLDNAMQAAIKSKEKQVSLDIYKENKELVIIIANTYRGKIDTSKMEEFGYTTKGKHHGVGLYLVRKILEKNKIFSQSNKVLKDYFIQELRVNKK